MNLRWRRAASTASWTLLALSMAVTTVGCLSGPDDDIELRQAPCLDKLCAGWEEPWNPGPLPLEEPVQPCTSTSECPNGQICNAGTCQFPQGGCSQTQVEAAIQDCSGQCDDMGRTCTLEDIAQGNLYCVASNGILGCELVSGTPQYSCANEAAFCEDSGPQEACGSANKACGNCQAEYEQQVASCCTHCSTMFCFGGAEAEFMACLDAAGEIPECCAQPAVPPLCGTHCPDFPGPGCVNAWDCPGWPAQSVECSAGVCLASPSPGQGPGWPTSGCENDWECPLGEVCWGGALGNGYCAPDGQTSACVLDGHCTAGETCSCEAACCTGGGGAGSGGSGAGGACGWDGGPTISYGDCFACGGMAVWSDAHNDLLCEGLAT